MLHRPPRISKALHRRLDMRVKIPGYPDRAVAQSLGNNLQVNTLRQHQGGVCVAQVVEPQFGHPRIPHQPLNALVTRSGRSGLPSDWQNTNSPSAALRPL